MNLPRQCAIVVALAGLLAGCGGGGNSPQRINLPPALPPPPPPPPPAPDNPDADAFRTPEFNRSWGLDAINAAEAYAQGYTGEGVIIGILDFNFDFGSDELNLHPASAGRNAQLAAIYEAQIGEPVADDEHGQAVAVIAAGLKNDFETHGVAFDAQVLAVDFFSGVNGTQVVEDGILLHISNPWTYLTDNGARVVNKSLGFDEGDIIVNPPVVDEVFIIEVDAHVVAEGALLVSSAGNNSDPDPSLSNLNTIDILRDNNLLDEGPGAFMIVGAVDRNNQMASFSDRAGIAKDYYLVAPGVEVVFPWNGVLSTGSGTSFSAPHVTGAAALLFQRWPTLSARDVANILFESATDLGAPGVDEIFGHGLLNLEAALQPIGASSVAVQGHGKTTALVSGSAIVLGRAFGDAAALRPALSSVMMLDGFSRDFQIDLTGFVSSRPGRSSLHDIADQRLNWRASSVGVAGVGQLNFAVARDARDRATLAFTGQAGSDIGAQGDFALELSGRYHGFSWSAGTGRRMIDVLAGQSQAADGARPYSLTQAFTPAVNTGSGVYAVGGLALGRNIEMKLSVSMAENAGLDFHPIEKLRADASIFSAAARLDHYGASSWQAVEVGMLAEDNAILGSRATGGLAITDQSRTGWITLEGEKNFGRRFFVTASATAALTDPGQMAGSLFQSFGSIVSTSFSVGLSGRDLMRKDDVLSLTLHQPLHVERAPVTLVSGVGRDLDTGAVIFGEDRLSLSPSGREFAVESAYRLMLGSWIAEANVAYRFDADHVAGRRDAVGLLWLSRGF